MKRTVLAARTRKRLEALQKADLALYELWKQSEINSDEMVAINNLQKKFIQPGILAITEKGEAA
jgi:hypothetical protein